MTRLLLILTLIGCSLTLGCRNNVEKPTVRAVTSLDEIQGKWKVVEATDPNGNGYDAFDLQVEIKGTIATSQERPLRLEFNADNSYMKMYATQDGVEKLVGEASVEITTEATPTQMVWVDRTNTKQVTLLERLP